MMRAYFSEPRISVLADYPCYHWVLRDRDINASWGQLDPESYFAFMREVLDIVDEHTEPGPFRDRLYARWYRGKMLNRVEKIHSNPDARAAAPLYAAMHELAVERFPDGVDAFLPFNLRARSALLRAGRLRRARGAADFETALRAQARAIAVRPVAGGVELELEARARRPALRARRRAARVGRRPARRDRRAARAAPSSCCSSGARRRRSTACRPRSSGGSPTGPTAAAAPWSRHRPRDRRNAARRARRCRPALWEVHAIVIVAGFRARRARAAARGAEHLMLSVAPDGRVLERRPGWQRNLRRRMPRPVVRAIRERQRAVRRRDATLSPRNFRPIAWV